MNPKLMLKLYLALAGAVIFWFFAVLVFIAYAFMPASKGLNQLIFTAVYPVIYIVTFNLLLAKIFKESGWRAWLVNTGLIIAMGALAIGILDLLSKLFKILGG